MTGPVDGPAPVDRHAVAARLADVRRRIAGAGGDDGIRVLAVTKGFGPDAVEAALELGLTAVGENYAQELVAKVEALGTDRDPMPRWHFLGRLQRNKVRLLAPHVGVWESVDRGPLVDEIAKRAPGAVVYVQVDLSGEPQKGGAAPAEVPGLVARARDAGLAVRGLMGVGPAGPAEAARPGFRMLVALADELGLVERSIGMTGDLEVAVAEGATEVRVGTALFGPRPSRADPPSPSSGGAPSPSDGG
ncbi:YggS family pyridoxal phosphate-dependent enzyme [Rhabdothermincola salaria]|uniref:YggS family pyridoxal phosphate-dependent enzyme n=1 Tax=Rhabdothermincola salaria TaxID=2903142 RepID=UPI001E3764DF|nr:YggS family pyridoxal phosphate-dependent enzyme [Rhabdothermincola salaria]